MATTFEFPATTTASVDEVWECYQDAAYWEVRMAAAGSANDRITRFDADDTRVVVEFEQVVGGENIPSFVSKIHKGDLPITRSVTYNAPSDGVIDAVSSGEALGGIVSVTGTITVRAEGESTLEVAEGRVSASVPLVGKKVEKLIIDYLSDAHVAEVATIDEYRSA